MRIRMIRHGKTEGNLTRCYIGYTDQPLCKEGRKELKKAFETSPDKERDIQVKTVYVTPLVRTKQTAKILFPKAKQVIVPPLQEMNFGAFEGKNYLDLTENQAYQTWLNSNCEGPCPAGESKAMFTERCKNGFLELVTKSQEEEIIMVVHGGTIMAVGDTLVEPHKSYFEWHVECGAQRVFEWNGQYLEEVE